MILKCAQAQPEEVTEATSQSEDMKPLGKSRKIRKDPSPDFEARLGKRRELWLKSGSMALPWTSHTELGRCIKGLFL